jgi:polyphosphate kinase
MDRRDPGNPLLRPAAGVPPVEIPGVPLPDPARPGPAEPSADRVRKNSAAAPPRRGNAAKPVHGRMATYDGLIKHRDISWLSFNGRVLQEADDPSVPLVERLKFLGIFSSNLDEFFRVRVATLRKLVDLGDRAQQPDLGFNPRTIHSRIQRIVVLQQRRFQDIYQRIVSALEQRNIYFRNETQLDEQQGRRVKEYFQSRVLPALVPIMMGRGTLPELKDNAIYLVVRMSRKDGALPPQHALIELPTGSVPRFLVMPGPGNGYSVILLDDIVRYCLEDVFYIFTYDTFQAHTIKLTRDADITVDNDLSQSFVERISRSLKQRRRGRPVRFVYDRDIPDDLLASLTRALRFSKQDPLIPGARYHNFRDFIDFPRLGPPDLTYPALRVLRNPELLPSVGMFLIIDEKDLLVHYPYQSFDAMIRFLREAAIDPEVRSIKMTLYRAAKDSRVVNALINAVKNGKAVTVVVELQARFNEEDNITLANRLAEEGATVVYGMPALKIHCKLTLVTKLRHGRTVRYGNLATGNYNEQTAQLYCDSSLFTSDPRITEDVERVFQYIEGKQPRPTFSHLLVAPLFLRQHLEQLVDEEIRNAQAGRPASILLKVNSLVDESVVAKLYQAGQAGVRIRIIARSACSLVPGLRGYSGNIEAIGIVDRLLEHARVFVFGNGGDPRVFLSSADLMTRNLDYRVEVAWPVLDDRLKRELLDLVELQWQDNTKARVLNRAQNNRYRRTSGPPVRAQDAIGAYLSRRRSHAAL